MIMIDSMVKKRKVTILLLFCIHVQMIIMLIVIRVSVLDTHLSVVLREAQM